MVETGIVPVSAAILAWLARFCASVRVMPTKQLDGPLLFCADAELRRRIALAPTAQYDATNA